MPKISVIIPCYNVSKWINRCISSLINQTLPNEDYEIICINDGSTDNTLTILKGLRVAQPKLIKIIDCKENRKLGTARNIGLKNAGGDWIAFIDGDDWVEKDYLETLYRVAISKNCDVISCRPKADRSETLTYFENTSLNEKDQFYHTLSPALRKQFYVEQPLWVVAWAKLIKKDFLIKNKILFPEDVYFEDMYWTNILNLYITKSCMIEKTLYHYFIGNREGISAQRDNDNLKKMHLNMRETLWKDLTSRECFTEYQQEIEYQYFLLSVVNALKLAIQKFNKLPSFQEFQQLKISTLKKIPNIKDNKYIKRTTTNPAYKKIVSLLYDPITEKEFYQIAEALKYAL